MHVSIRPRPVEHTKQNLTIPRTMIQCSLQRASVVSLSIALSTPILNAAEQGDGLVLVCVTHESATRQSRMQRERTLRPRTAEVQAVLIHQRSRTAGFALKKVACGMTCYGGLPRWNGKLRMRIHARARQQDTMCITHCRCAIPQAQVVAVVRAKGQHSAM